MHQHSCLVDNVRALAIQVPYVRDGPHWVLADGLEMLRSHGYTIKPVARICSMRLGRFVVCRDGHGKALRRYEKDDTWTIDGKDRERVAEKDLDAHVGDTKVSEAPSRCNPLCTRLCGQFEDMSFLALTIVAFYCLSPKVLFELVLPFLRR